ncbi:hypothetical protein LJB95_00515, partial [Paludibacteraceae bacterium OttesenSCG-928-F17]|nr:hypothetical protein [Paludibacteraceae bacterium OttesenSCG-928-F17]
RKDYLVWLKKYEHISMYVKSQKPKSSTLNTFFSMYSSLEELECLLKYEFLMKKALVEYRKLDFNNDMELLKWLLKYEYNKILAEDVQITMRIYFDTIPKSNIVEILHNIYFDGLKIIYEFDEKYRKLLVEKCSQYPVLYFSEITEDDLSTYPLSYFLNL